MNILNLTNEKKENKYIIILYYEGDHYQTVGYFTQEVPKSFFERSKLPLDIKLILNRKKLLLKHCEILLKSNNNKSLNDILKDLYTNSFIDLSIDDKKDICHFINSEKK
jgi:hypothetical protein